MKSLGSENEPYVAWAAYKSGSLAHIREVIADEYRHFDMRHQKWILAESENQQEKEEWEAEQESVDRAQKLLELQQREDGYYDELLEGLADDGSGDEGSEVSDSENVADVELIKGFYNEPNNLYDPYNEPADTQSSDTTDSDNEQPEPPTFTAKEWKQGRALLWKMRAEDSRGVALLAMEADWLRLALVNQECLHVFHSKQAFGKTMLREIELQSYVTAYKSRG